MGNKHNVGVTLQASFGLHSNREEGDRLLSNASIMADDEGILRMGMLVQSGKDDQKTSMSYLSKFSDVIAKAAASVQDVEITAFYDAIVNGVEEPCASFVLPDENHQQAVMTGSVASVVDEAEIDMTATPNMVDGWRGTVMNINGDWILITLRTV